MARAGRRNVDDGQVVVSEFNKLEGNRYYDVESQTSFEVDHITQVGFPYGHRVCLHADGWLNRKPPRRNHMPWTRRTRT